MTAIDIQPERPTLSLPPVAPLVLAVVGVALVCVMAFPFGQWRYVIAVCIGNAGWNRTLPRRLRLYRCVATHRYRTAQPGFAGTDGPVGRDLSADFSYYCLRVATLRTWSAQRCMGSAVWRNRDGWFLSVWYGYAIGRWLRVGHFVYRRWRQQPHGHHPVCLYRRLVDWDLEPAGMAGSCPGWKVSR